MNLSVSIYTVLNPYNSHLRKSPVSIRHPHGVVMHYFSIGKCIEKSKMLQKSCPLQKDHPLLTLRFELLNHFQFFLSSVKESSGRQTVPKYFRNAWSQDSKYRWPYFHLFLHNWSHDPNLSIFSCESSLHSLRHSRMKTALDSLFWCWNNEI